MDKDDIMVSICCITYNHEKYIAKALDSFLMQKTNFNFEIIIYDDASTDNTANIIKKYQLEYPHIIKPIFQTENQYSKGIKTSTFAFARAKGKYFAVCEGDDYWTDPLKLQKQVDYLEKHPDCSMCFHDAILVNVDNKLLGKFKGSYSRVEGIKNIDELRFIPTASKVFRRECFDKAPKWCEKSPYGDFANMLVCSNFGYIYYLNEIMSAYRTNVPGSAMDMVRKNSKVNIESQIPIYISRINELNYYNEWSNYKNDKYVQKLHLHAKFKLFVLQRNLKELKKEEYQHFFKEMSFWRRFKTFLWLYTPKSFYNLLLKVRDYFSSLISDL